LRWECPPEGARNLQGCLRHTGEHISQRNSSDFTSRWKDLQRGEVHCLNDREKREREREDRGLLTEGSRGGAQVAGDGGRRRWRPPESRGDGGRWESPRTEKTERSQGKMASGLARAGGCFFLKRDMGTPDSLQCLSGAHRTAHSRCPVNHRTAHRKRGTSRAAAGAPDIAQCSVRCTPDCLVSPDRGEFGKF
jgi:hypothetical protein